MSLSRTPETFPPEVPFSPPEGDARVVPAKEPEPCALCGLPVGRARSDWLSEKGTLHFCCPGCRGVYQILFSRPGGIPQDPTRTDLFRACREAGLIPSDEKDLRAREGDALPRESEDPGEPPGEGDGLELLLRVEGMWCPACGWLIEEVLKKTEGIAEARVFFLADTARVRYDPRQLTPGRILARIESLGYFPGPHGEPETESGGTRGLLLRLGISAVLAANVMMISWALYSGFFQELGGDGIGYLSITLWALSTPVVLYGGLPILRRGLAGLRHLRPNMETLISLGTLSAYLYSVLQVLRGSLHLYFDTASMLVALVLLGKTIEARAREKVSRTVKDLYGLVSRKVRLAGEGREKWVPIETVPIGAEFIVLPGERIPLDGRVASGRAWIDESTFTGESRPISRSSGEEILGGALLLEGRLRACVIRVGDESVLAQMMGLVQEALSARSPMERLADRFTRWFVPLVLALAGGAAAWAWEVEGTSEAAVLRALAVIVISCPCALGIATPLAKVAAIGAGRDAGIWIRDPGALERARDVDAMVLDKTGTLTEGRFGLRETAVPREDPDDVLARVASLERGSDHFLAREIVARAEGRRLEIPDAEDREEAPGLGVRGRVAGVLTAAGNRAWMDRNGLRMDPFTEARAASREARGASVVFLGWDGEVKGFMALGDSLRPGAGEAVRALRSRGVQTWIVSGDSPQTTGWAAEETGADHYRGGALPADKVSLVRRLQGEGRRVGVAGDGVNDAAALAAADVGFALGPASNMARETASFHLLDPDPRAILKTLSLSTKARKTIRQNLVFSVVYNVIAIPMAMAGFLNPLVAVLAMFASSLTVIGNSSRLRRGPIASRAAADA